MGLPVIIDYICNTCRRTISLPSNKYGITTLRSCIITQNCNGTMNRVISSATNVIPTSVPGMQDWVQRRGLFTLNQTVPSMIWIVNHNMGLIPILEVYINQTTSLGGTILSPTLDYTTTINSPFTLTIQFNQQQTGTVQCISSSANPVVVTPVTTTASTTTQITNDGILTLGILSSITPTSSTLNLQNPSIANNTINYNYFPEPNINSPWHDWNNVILFNQIYNIYTINLNQFTTQTGSQITIANLNSNISFNGQMIILLATSPYTNNDKNVMQYIPVTPTTPLVVSSGELVINNQYITNVYPYLIESPYIVGTTLIGGGSTTVLKLTRFLTFVVTDVSSLMQQYTLYPQSWTLESFQANITQSIDLQLASTDLEQIVTTPSFDRTLVGMINSAYDNKLTVNNWVGDPSWLLAANNTAVLTQIEQMSNLPFTKLILNCNPQEQTAGTLVDAQNWLLNLVASINTINTIPLWVVLDYTILAPNWSGGTPTLSSIVQSLSQLNVVGIVVRYYSTNTTNQILLMEALTTAFPQMLFKLELSLNPALPVSESYALYSLSNIIQTITTLNNSLNIEGFTGIILNSWNEYYNIANPL